MNFWQNFSRKLQEKKFFLWLFLFSSIFMPLFFNGCSNVRPHIKVAFDLDDNEWSIMRDKIIPEFEKKNKIVVEAIQVEKSDVLQLLKAMGSSKDTKIDIFLIDVKQLQEFVDNKMVEDISEFGQFSNKRINQNLIYDLYFGDRLYCVPLKINLFGFYFSNDKNNMINLSFPSNFRNFISAIKRFNKRNKSTNIVLPFSNKESIAIFIYQTILSSGGKPMDFGDRRTHSAFVFLKDLWNYASPASLKANFSNILDYIQNGTPNFLWGKFSSLKMGNTKKELLFVGSIDGAINSKTLVDADVLCVSKGSKNKGNALKFLQYLYSHDVQKLFYSDLNWIPLRKGVIGDIRGKKQYRIILRILRRPVYIKNEKDFKEFETKANDAFTRILIKKEDISKVLKDINEKAKKKSSTQDL